MIKLSFMYWGNHNKKVRGKLNFKKKKKISWIKVSMWIMPVCIIALCVVTVTFATKQEKSIQANKAVVSDKIVEDTAQGNEKKLLLVVNDTNPLPKDYEVKLKSFNGFRFNEIMVKNLESLVNAAKSQGHSIKITQGYTESDEQQKLYDDMVAKIAADNPKHTKVESILEANKRIGTAETDEHRTGLLVDFEGEDSLYTWLLTNAPKYGFVQRYPKTKDTKTHRSFTPNVFRYVGVDFAQKMQLTGMCLDEYVKYLD